MIERIYIKEYLSFAKVELEFQKGLIVFTGASGTGKSVLLDGLLATFGLKDNRSKISEAILNIDLKLEDFDFDENEAIVFKSIKKEKLRYFINNQVASKNRIKTISSKFIKHLNLKDLSDFENENLLNMIDLSINNKNYKKLLESFQCEFQKYIELKKELNEIEKNYKELMQLKDFLEFEIAKIEEINPQIKEYDELLEHKKHLSKKEKIDESLNSAYEIFNFERVVDEALTLADEDGNFFSDCMNELRNRFEIIKDKINELEHINIEELLERLEELSSLKRKYGSIEEALIYKDEKKEELLKYENTQEKRDEIGKEILELEPKLLKLAQEIREIRVQNIDKIEKKLNEYLNMLYLKNAKISLEKTNLTKFGIDRALISLNSVSLEHISFGEFNRLRLALLATKSFFDKNDGGILFLDEIDANLSGKESQSIGKVLSYLSKSYQIFSISHQPQLTSSANQHFLVEKVDNLSKVSEVKEENRIKEIARMISGDEITKEAIEFAKKMIEEAR